MTTREPEKRLRILSRLKMKVFHAWFLVTRPMTLGVRALAFDSSGRLLLVRHTYVEGWHLPGGGVEHGQTVPEALVREMREEANAEIGDTPELISLHHNTSVTRRDHVALYLCRKVRQTMAKSRDREILSAEFFALDDLPAGTTEATLRRLNERLNRLPPDPYW